MRSLLLLSVVGVAIWSQELPTVALMSSTFVGEHRPSGATQPYELRIVADTGGNKFTIQSLFDLVTLRPPLYREFGYLRKIGPDNATVWTSRFDGKKLTGLALDPSGNVWVSGFDTNGFVTQVSPAGNVVRTVAIEGVPTGLAIDPSGFVYVTGSANGKFTTTAGAWKRDIGELKCSDSYGTVYFACQEAFALKLSPDASRVVYATFIGGTRDEKAFDVAVGSDGSAYIVGETRQTIFLSRRARHKRDSAVL